jgi:hypothetical protein
MTIQEFEAIKEIVNDYECMSRVLGELRVIKKILQHGGHVENILITNHLNVQTHALYGQLLPTITPIVLEQMTIEIDRLESSLGQLSPTPVAIEIDRLESSLGQLSPTPVAIEIE